MNKRRFVVEMGTGIDQHGQDVTKAAVTAVKEAISRVCLCGLSEIIRLRDPNEMFVEVTIACPRPHEVRTEEVLKVLPFGQRQIEVVEGGMLAKVTLEPKFGDKTDFAVVANAAITVSVDMDKVLAAWGKTLSPGSNLGPAASCHLQEDETYEFRIILGLCCPGS